MADTAVFTDRRQQEIQEFIDRMPSLSTTVTKVLEICNRANTSPNDLNRVISLDPVLTGQVLKLINSAYYSLPNQITSLTRAIIMLGLNTVKNLALSTAVLGTLGRAESFRSLPMDGFWAHSICVGVAARLIAENLGVPAVMREEFFVAGLLHDLGKIPLNHRFAEEYSQILELARLEQGPLVRAETMILGLDHGEVGGMIAAKWQLSETMQAALVHHHDPDSAPEEHRHLAAVVALANMYANVYDIGYSGDPYQQWREVRHVLGMLNISWRDLDDIAAEVDEEIEKAQVFLHVTREGR